MNYSFVIITRNRLQSLRKAIDSIVEKFHGDYEIIIVDNHSTEYDSREIEKAYSFLEENIKLIMLDKNYGVAGARNIGYNAAKTENVIFLDDDAYLEGIVEGEKLDGILESNKEIKAISFNVYDMQKRSQLTFFSEKYSNGQEILAYIGCAHLIRKEEKCEVLYPEKLMYGGEELYKSLKIYKNNGKIMQSNLIKVIHEPSNKTRYSPQQIIENNIVNQYLIKKLCLPRILHPLLRIVFLIRIIKNIKITRGKVAELKDLMSERYAKNYSEGMSVVKWLELGRRFGFSKLV